MIFNVQIGPVQAAFLASGIMQPVRKIANYRKPKPEGWTDGDLYFAANSTAIVQVRFMGEAVITVNDQTYNLADLTVVLGDGWNEIEIVHDGKEYYLAVAVVRQIGADESRSGGIRWAGSDDNGYFFFDDQGFWDGLWGLFARHPYLDDRQEIVVDGWPFPGESSDLVCDS